MEEYAIYLRKSREDLDAEKIGKFETLARHKRALLELADRRGYKIGMIYQEIVSGESIDSRPEMQRLLEDVYRKKWAGVLVYEVERLARGNTKDQGEVANAFVYSNTKIITPLKIYDPQSETDMEYFEFGLFMSRREYKTINRRLNAGLMDWIAQGNYCGPYPPFGYKIVQPSKKERTLEFDPATEPYMRMMIQWAKDKVSFGEIARRLTDLGIPTGTGRPEWSGAVVRDTLANPVYAGKIWFGHRGIYKEYSDGEIVKSQKRKKEYKIYDGKHPAMITWQEHEEIVGWINSHTSLNTTGILQNPLAGLLVCPNCGRSIIRKVSLRKDCKRPNISYRHPQSKFCFQKCAPVTQVIDILAQQLQQDLEENELFLQSEDNSARVIDWEKAKEKLASDLQAAEKKRTQLYDLLEDGTYSKEEFAERRETYNARIIDIKSRIAKHDQIKPDYQTAKEFSFALQAAIEMLADPETSAEDINNFLKSFIRKIKYYSTDLGVHRGATVKLMIEYK